MGGNFVSLGVHLQRLTVPIGSGKRRGEASNFRDSSNITSKYHYLEANSHFMQDFPWDHEFK
jgi:hypothetical protein